MHDPRDKAGADSHLPLTAPTFHILLALVDDERHGYAIMRDIEKRTSREMRMGPGTLYGSLKRLLDDGLLSERAVVTKASLFRERRRYYRITALGMEVARAEAHRLETLVRCARVKHLLESDGDGGGDGDDAPEATLRVARDRQALLVAHEPRTLLVAHEPQTDGSGHA